MSGDEWNDEEWNADRDSDECDHDEYDIDILTGRAECHFCPHSWSVTNEELAREAERQAEWHEWVDREERRIRWRERFAFILDPIDRMRRRYSEWKIRRQFPEHANDDIPF